MTGAAFFIAYLPDNRFPPILDIVPMGMVTGAMAADVVDTFSVISCSRIGFLRDIDLYAAIVGNYGRAVTHCKILQAYFAVFRVNHF